MAARSADLQSYIFFISVEEHSEVLQSEDLVLKETDQTTVSTDNVVNALP